MPDTTNETNYIAPAWIRDPDYPGYEMLVDINQPDDEPVLGCSTPKEEYQLIPTHRSINNPLVQHGLFRQLETIKRTQELRENLPEGCSDLSVTINDYIEESQSVPSSRS